MVASNRPRVVVVGAGGMGSAFGALLREGGLDVILVDPSQAHIDAIARQKGIVVSGHGGTRLVPIAAVADAARIESADIVFFQCKAVHNRQAATGVRHLFGKAASPVAVSFQNGLGNEAVIGSIIGPEHVLAGQTSQAASLEKPGHVHHFANLPTILGEMDGTLSERATRWARILTAHGLDVEAKANVMREKWQKLFANIGYSAISGATGRTLGDIVTHPALRETALRAIDEAAAVAAAHGTVFTQAEARDIFFQLVAPPEARANRSSMRRDIEVQRLSEVEQIYESVIALGAERAVPTPTLQTLAAIIRGIELPYQPAA